MEYSPKKMTEELNQENFTLKRNLVRTLLWTKILSTV